MKLLTALSVIYFALLSYSISDGGYFSSNISVYPIECSEKRNLSRCGGTEYTLRKTSFKVLPDRQEVLRWTDGFPVERLTKCAVSDRTNWSCKWRDESSFFGFKSGGFFDINLPPSPDKYDERTIYVSRLEWLRFKCGGWTALLWCAPVLTVLAAE